MELQNINEIAAFNREKIKLLFKEKNVQSIQIIYHTDDGHHYIMNETEMKKILYVENKILFKVLLLTVTILV